jgi:hypothetical protein
MTRWGVVGWLAALGATAVVLAGPGTSWAQAQAPTDGGQPGPTGRTVVAGIGAVVGTVVFATFKAVVMCPVGAVAAGTTYAVTGGEKETADYLLRLGCTGTYFISPAMVQGQEAFRRYDER